MVGNVARFKDRKGEKNDPPKNNNPANRFRMIVKTGTSIGEYATLARAGIEESPGSDEKQALDKMKDKIKTSKLTASERDRLLAYIELSEKKGNRGAVQRAGEVTKLYMDKNKVYGSETAIKTEVELMEAYANGNIEKISQKVIKALWGKTDEISKLWLKAINTAMQVQIPENNPQRRESALFYILKRYHYTTYPNSAKYTEDELAKTIRGSIKVLETW